MHAIGRGAHAPLRTPAAVDTAIWHERQCDPTYADVSFCSIRAPDGIVVIALTEEDQRMESWRQPVRTAFVARLRLA